MIIYYIFGQLFTLYVLYDRRCLKGFLEELEKVPNVPILKVWVGVMIAAWLWPAFLLLAAWDATMSLCRGRPRP